MNYRDLTMESTSDLVDQKDHLAFRLSSQNPAKNYFGSPSRKRTAQWELSQVRKELQKKYRWN